MGRSLNILVLVVRLLTGVTQASIRTPYEFVNMSTASFDSFVYLRILDGCPHICTQRKTKRVRTKLNIPMVTDRGWAKKCFVRLHINVLK